VKKKAKKIKNQTENHSQNTTSKNSGSAQHRGQGRGGDRPTDKKKEGASQHLILGYGERGQIKNSSGTRDKYGGNQGENVAQGRSEPT